MAEQPFHIAYKFRAAACCALFVCLTFGSYHFHLDDALIYARYISNALHGRGLVFNPGEPVNALTSILDTWLQLGFAWLFHGNVLAAQLVLGSLFFLPLVLIAEYSVAYSGMIIAASSLFYYCSGMETSLFLFCIWLTAYAYHRDKIDWLPTLCVLVALARFEGAALAVFIVWRLWQKKRFPSPSAFILPALLIAAYLWTNVHFYHHLLPQSATAKFGQGRSGFWGHYPLAFLLVSPIVYRPLGTAWSFMPILTILAGYGAARPEGRKYNQIMMPFLILLAGFYIVFNIPSYFWYFAPFVYFFTISAARLLPATRTAVCCTLFIIFLMTSCSFRDLWKSGRSNKPAADYIAAGNWIRQNTPVDAHIAAVETGTIGWTCDRYLEDIVGLTDPANATYTAHRDFSSWINERPDYIVVHLDDRFPWEHIALVSPDYVLLPVTFGEVGILARKSPHPTSAP